MQFLTGLPIAKALGIAALAAMLTLTVLWKAADRRADKWEAQSRKCAVARDADRNAYVAAQNEARRLNDAEVARIEQDQRRITDETTRDLNHRLERLRSELRKAAPAPQGSAGRPSTGPNGGTQPRADGPAGLCLAPEELLRGAENEERHEQLIRWVEKQLGVNR